MGQGFFDLSIYRAGRQERALRSTMFRGILFRCDSDKRKCRGKPYAVVMFKTSF